MFAWTKKKNMKIFLFKSVSGAMAHGVTIRSLSADDMISIRLLLKTILFTNKKKKVASKNITILKCHLKVVCRFSDLPGKY